MYLPSAGPPCFLDPILFHLNFELINIFPRAPKFLTYLKERLNESYQVYAPEIVPGDIIDVAKCNFAYRKSERASEDKFDSYIRLYAAKYEKFFKEREYNYSQQQIVYIIDRLRQVLEDKLSYFTMNECVERSLYIQLQDAPKRVLCVNFQEQRVEETSEVPESNYYLLTSPSWQIAHVLNGKLTWEDFALTFRMRLTREPDNYETLIQGFLILESEDLKRFCENLKEIKSNTERITVDAGGCRYSVDKLCPHQGAELSEGWIEEDRYLVCSRHRWRYDLQNHGLCETSHDSINALLLEED
jgi:UDP-MurNAc hydroxylase